MTSSFSINSCGVKWYFLLFKLDFPREFQNMVGKPLCVSRLSHSWTYCPSRPLPWNFWTHLSIDTFRLRFPTQLSPGPFSVQREVETRIIHTIFNCRYQVLVAQLCLTLCDPMDCSPPGSSVHRILQARILEWVAIPFCGGSSPPRDWTQVCWAAGRFFTIWATREVLWVSKGNLKFFF